MSNIELVEFIDELVTINIFLGKEAVAEFKDTWENKVASCQQPMIFAHKEGLSVILPWILKEGVEEEFKEL